MDPVSLCCSLSPYIIGTTNQPVKMTPNHGLHLSFRWELSLPGGTRMELGWSETIALAPGQSWGHILMRV